MTRYVKWTRRSGSGHQLPGNLGSRGKCLCRGGCAPASGSVRHLGMVQSPSANADWRFLNEFVKQPGMLGLRFVIWTKEQQESFSDGRLDWVWWRAQIGWGFPWGSCYL